MIDIAKIEGFIEEKLQNSDLFLVDVKCSIANEIEVLIDSDGSVGIDRCIELSRAIEETMDREAEDFELTVSSAGIGQPLKVLRQYQKLVGRSVEVLLKSGIKIIAILKDVTPNALTISYEEKIMVEGMKRKQLVEKIQTYAMEDIKSTKEYLDFK